MLLGTMIVTAFAQILLRNFFDQGILWADALLRHLVLWVGLWGAVVATRRDRHITIDIVSKFIAPRCASAVRVVTDAFTLVASGIVAYAGVRFILDEMDSGTTGFGDVPSWILESIIPLAFTVIALRYARYFVVHLGEAIRGKEPPAKDGRARRCRRFFSSWRWPARRSSR
ncbi:MAG: TRAP transporter small permease [Deltaproteobacteria bacterium]|nr:TRAP transporter small permease [Deltaproteobacteria bacterium]